jgi:hypothetical protein
MLRWKRKIRNRFGRMRAESKCGPLYGGSARGLTWRILYLLVDCDEEAEERGAHRGDAQTVACVPLFVLLAFGLWE